MPADDNSLQQQLQMKKKMVQNVVRATGVVFLLAGTAFGFNLGGIDNVLGLTDGLIQKVFGGALFSAGIFDYFVVPFFLNKKMGGFK